MDDLLPGVLAQIQVNGQIYAYPYTLNPVVLQYDPEALAAARIAPPAFDWTVDQFIDTLNQLESSNPQATPFSPRQGENTDFLMLIAAFGGLLLDYRTDPPTFNLTAPKNVAAVRQVLDLAKNRRIAYAALGTNTVLGNIPRGTFVASLLSGQLAESRAFIDFPQGSGYPVLSFGDISAGYISATTSRPEACYRLLRALTAYPELFAGAMPTRRSALQDSTVKAALGEERVAFFQRYADLASAPNAIVFPANALSGTRAVDLFMMNYWMNRAFDRYVLENANLEVELSTAQALIEAFQTCMADQPVPARSASLFAQQIYFTAGYACFAGIDPDTYAEWTTQP